VATDGTSSLKSFQDALNLAKQAGVGISMNNGNLIALNQKVQTIQDAPTRAALTARIQDHVKRQAAIVSFYNGVASKLSWLRTSLKNWLASIGITDVPGLGELGFLPAVPAAIVAVLVVVAAAAATIITANALHSGAIADTGRVVDSVLSGQLTPEAGAALIKSLSDQANQQVDALGIKSAISSLVPILAIGAAVIFLPNILALTRELVPHRSSS
jgi:hypothetical protein